MTVYMHYTCYTLLFQCIFAGECKSLSSFLTVQRLIVSKLVELYMSLAYCVIQSSFHDPQ